MDLSAGLGVSPCPILCALFLTQTVPVKSVEEESPGAQDWKFTEKVLFVKKQQDTELLGAGGWGEEVRLRRDQISTKRILD